MILLEKILRPLVYLFHPLFLGIYILLFQTFYFSKQGEYPLDKFFLMLLSIVILSIGIPILVVKLMGGNDMMLKERKSREIPTLVGVFVSLANFIIPYFLGYGNSPISFFYLTAAFCLFAIYLFNFSIKASQHGAGITVFCIFLCVMFFMQSLELKWYFQFPILALFIAIITQRKISKSHTWPELILGVLIGLVSFVLVIILNINKLLPE